MTTMTQARSTFQVKGWDEQTSSDVDGHLKITHAVVAFAYSGDVEGDGAMQYLMLYRDDGTATVVGMERITAQLAGRSGSFVLQHSGSYADGVASGEFEVVAGSGSGQLAGLRGRGTAVAHKDGTTQFTLEYDLPAQ
jgi:hypothetical protein